jgi:hypothetical protein
MRAWLWRARPAAARQPHWTGAVLQPALRPASDLHPITSVERAAVTIAAVFERDLDFAPFPVTLHFHPGVPALLQSGYDAVLARTPRAQWVQLLRDRAIAVGTSARRSAKSFCVRGGAACARARPRATPELQTQ